MQTYRNAVLCDSPKIYYRGGESSGTVATDLGSAGSNGTYTGGFTLNQLGALLNDVGTATALNGSSGYIATSFVVPVSTTIWSGEAFVRTLSSGSGGSGPSNSPTFVLFGFSGNPNVGGTTAFEFGLTGGNLHYSCWNNGTNVKATGTANVADGKWHHIGFTHNGTAGTVRLTVDGVVDANTTTGTPVAASNGFTISWIGVGSDGASGKAGWWNGNVQEMALFVTNTTNGRTFPENRFNVARQVPSQGMGRTGVANARPGIAIVGKGLNVLTVYMSEDTWPVPRDSISRLLSSHGARNLIENLTTADSIQALKSMFKTMTETLLTIDNLTVGKFKFFKFIAQFRLFTRLAQARTSNFKAQYRAFTFLANKGINMGTQNGAVDVQPPIFEMTAREKPTLTFDVTAQLGAGQGIGTFTQTMYIANTKGTVANAFIGTPTTSGNNISFTIDGTKLKAGSQYYAVIGYTSTGGSVPSQVLECVVTVNVKI